MTGNLKIVAKYGTPEEAHLIRNRLEGAGIPAFLDGETAAGWAWHFANAIGGVRVLVPEEHAHAAEAILAGGETPGADAMAESAGETSARSAPADEEVSASWRCAHCGAQVDSAMDVCWACGAMRPDEESEPSAWGPEVESPPDGEPKEPAPPSPGVALLTVLFPPTFAFFLFTKLCEFLAPWVPDARHHPLPEATESPGLEEAGSPEPGGIVSREPAWQDLECRRPDAGEVAAPDEGELDDLVLRAWRAALMGFFLMPPLVMTLYSLRLLVRYWSRRRRPHRPRDRRAGWTLVVNVVAALGLGLLVGLAAAGFFRSGYDGLPRAPGVMGPNEERREP